MAVSQEELYATLDLELSWSERDLPEHVRTKHVHRLHPYHGKFIPQLVEVLLDRYLPAGGHVLDPFAGSGTTLVQALESGLDATGVELAAFNCLLMRVKTAHYDVEALGAELRDVCARVDSLPSRKRTSGYVRRWYEPQAAAELLAFRELIGEYEHQDLLRIVLSRAARSARRAAHFDLEAPREPQVGEYWCHKHRRTCRPVASAAGFLRRYTLDTLARIEAFAAVRDETREARVIHGDACEVEYAETFDGIVTSPPYPGLIDYHEQHRYAYELLGLEDRARPRARRRRDRYVTPRARGVPATASRGCSGTPPPRSRSTRPSSSSSTTAATSTRRSSSAPGSSCTSAASGT